MYANSTRNWNFLSLLNNRRIISLHIVKRESESAFSKNNTSTKKDESQLFKNKTCQVLIRNTFSNGFTIILLRWFSSFPYDSYECDSVSCSILRVLYLICVQNCSPFDYLQVVDFPLNENFFRIPQIIVAYIMQRYIPHRASSISNKKVSTQNLQISCKIGNQKVALKMR